MFSMISLNVIPLRDFSKQVNPINCGEEFFMQGNLKLFTFIFAIMVKNSLSYSLVNAVDFFAKRSNKTHPTIS